MVLQVPFQFSPRPYQLPLFDAFDSGYRRGICIEHRRAGKDKKAINLVAKKMLERVGFYAYFFPTYKQAKKVLWNGVDRNGFKFMDHIPHDIRKRTNDTDMLVELTNGSILQLIGTDNIDSFRGANPVGCVFSEFSWQNPLAWDTVRPILNENDGWALFITTPLGKNHAYRLYNAAKNNPKWFTQFLTVDNTKREDGRAVITKEDIDEERRMGMEEDMIQQEYYCSFDAAMPGAYYAEQMLTARKQGRIGKVPYDPALFVDTWWDLGFDDACSIGFSQTKGKELRIIDYEEHNGESLEFYYALLEAKKLELGFKYRTHYLPHDADAKNLNTGKSDRETLQELGMGGIEVVPIGSVQHGIQEVRSMFPELWIRDSVLNPDSVKPGAMDRMEMFIDRISQYHKEYDEARKTFRSKPEHDFNSHAADALRTIAMGRPKEQYVAEPDSPYLHDTPGRLG